MITAVLWPYCDAWLNFNLSINALYTRLWDVNFGMDRKETERDVFVVLDPSHSSKKKKKEHDSRQASVIS